MSSTIFSYLGVWNYASDFIWIALRVINCVVRSLVVICVFAFFFFKYETSCCKLLLEFLVILHVCRVYSLWVFYFLKLRMRFCFILALVAFSYLETGLTHFNFYFFTIRRFSPKFRRCVYSTFVNRQGFYCTLWFRSEREWCLSHSLLKFFSIIFAANINWYIVLKHATHVVRLKINFMIAKREMGLLFKCCAV